MPCVRAHASKATRPRSGAPERRTRARRIRALEMLVLLLAAGCGVGAGILSEGVWRAEATVSPVPAGLAAHLALVSEGARRESSAAESAAAHPGAVHLPEHPFAAALESARRSAAALPERARGQAQALLKSVSAELARRERLKADFVTIISERPDLRVALAQDLAASTEKLATYAEMAAAITAPYQGH